MNFPWRRIRLGPVEAELPEQPSGVLRVRLIPPARSIHAEPPLQESRFPSVSFSQADHLHSKNLLQLQLQTTHLQEEAAQLNDKLATVQDYLNEHKKLI